jgi:hypothetical protein
MAPTSLPLLCGNPELQPEPLSARSRPGSGDLSRRTAWRDGIPPCQLRQPMAASTSSLADRNASPRSSRPHAPPDMSEARS